MRSSVLRRFLDGSGHDAYRALGAAPIGDDGGGFRFRVWAPAAREVWVKGDFDGWRGVAMVRDGAFWRAEVAAAKAGQCYKFAVLGTDGIWRDKADPFARAAELRPGDASKLCDASTHRWRDAAWLKHRAKRFAPDRGGDQPIAIYEMHAGSWRRGSADGDATPAAHGSPEPGGFLNWREIAPLLVDHLQRLGFTHVELLPPMEHPYDPSWGYQVTGYFAPTARHGSPDDFRAFVDALHVANIGVIVDWVPAHFPKDDFGLARFDGTAAYAYDDPRLGEHPDWGTLVFDYARPEVRSFLLASVAYWLDAFHIDGVRVDAVASMLYLDYSRSEGEWLPNRFGGNWNLDAISLLQDLNRMVERAFPGVLTIAEESTAFPRVTGAPPPVGAEPTDGLGFALKWNMGWMHDTLGYLARAPEHRPWHHHDLTFPATYAHAERFVLPLSHDEVVHGKRSLLCKAGGRWQDGAVQLRLLLGWQWVFPGKKLVFMGVELADDVEWNVDVALRWARATSQPAQGMTRYLCDLNTLYRQQPALHVSDAHAETIVWIDADDRERSVYAFYRRVVGDGAADHDEAAIVVIASFSDLRHQDYAVSVPKPGTWRVLLCSDDARYRSDASLAASDPGLAADPQHLQPTTLQSRDVGGRQAVVLDLPPLTLWMLRHEEPGA